MQTTTISTTKRAADHQAPGRTTYVATLLAAIAGAVVLALVSTPVLAAGSSAGDVDVDRATPADATRLLAAVRRLHDAPGHEVRGIAMATLYLRLAPRAGAEPHDAIGRMAERLARRASGASAVGADLAALAAAATHGVHFVALPREGGGAPRWCYDGEAWRRVLALRPEPAQQARSLLELTRPDCIDPSLAPVARMALDAWRADLLDSAWPRGYETLPAAVKARLHMRRAGLWAERAQQLALAGRPMRAAAERARAELASVQRAALATDEDLLELAEATTLVEAARRGSEHADTLARASARGLRLVVHAGTQPGQTCVLLFAAEAALPAGAAGHGETRAPQRLAERCTSGRVWPHSAALQPTSRTLSITVQPAPGRTEVWIFRAADAPAAPATAIATARATALPRWRIDVQPGSAATPVLAQWQQDGR